MPESRFWYLRQLNVDQRLPADVGAELRSRAQLERWGHHADIFRGPADSGVSIVLKGRVWLQDRPDAAPVGLLRGDIFGRVDTELPADELSLRAHDDTLLAVLSREEFGELVEPHLGGVSTKVGRFRKRRDLWVPVKPLLFTDAGSRLAKVLLHLVKTEGELNEDEGLARLRMKLQAKWLAKLSSVDPMTVRRELEALEVNRILERGSDGELIWDVESLGRMAQSGGQPPRPLA
ncbi:Crp/Fnr family transcriptional regulator [Bradymonas sediminis]|uniref:Uncharacterized protein n=1 Tax=Bradymonas sediminis TaxID=1548548 RepID=A0A2Z4FHF5_9DELT|nr:Crp/Fnr family transcriptional regulator [Bradymonas sediminis]AWV88432.1 hypothetical protein DN745_03345 [Bradymonas sediminis]TDP77561.1 hypothetical protein DFR33_101463 [Bradymonas sediminis]